MAVLPTVFTLDLAVAVQCNPSVSLSSHVPSEQPVAVVSHAAVMGSVPPSFGSDSKVTTVQHHRGFQLFLFAATLHALV